jgi:2-polyprenyl-6-methoxyphenol hydroxylase-like FAD-dependent oxidoreductase
MFSRHQPEVLVAGAGPVGLTAALALANRSVDVEIVDEEIRTAAHSYGLALHPSTLSLLNDLGIAPQRFDQSQRIDTVAFYDGKERKAELHLSELDCEFPYLLVVRQSHLEDTLERALHNDKVKVKWHHRLSEICSENDKVVAEIQKLDRVSSGYAIAGTETEVAKKVQREPKFVIGADGHRSDIRSRLGIDFPEVGASEMFAVFELDCEPPLDGREVCIAIDGNSANVLWPLPDGRCRWSFQVWDEPGAPYDLHYKSRLAVQVGRDYFPHVTPELLSTLIDERAPWFGSWPGRIYWSVLARFERRLASGLGSGRVWLAGDSVHLTGPVGIQSMNAGMHESVDLADRLSKSLAADEDLDGLEEYGRNTTKEWKRMLGLEPTVIAESGAAPWVAENRGRILSCLPGSGAELKQLAGQIGLGFKQKATV